MGRCLSFGRRCYARHTIFRIGVCLDKSGAMQSLTRTRGLISGTEFDDHEPRRRMTEHMRLSKHTFTTYIRKGLDFFCVAYCNIDQTSDMPSPGGNRKSLTYDPTSHHGDRDAHICNVHVYGSMDRDRALPRAQCPFFRSIGYSFIFQSLTLHIWIIGLTVQSQ